MSNYNDFCARIDAHIQSITPEHEQAFAGPAVTHYIDGSVVWMLDHYNTAIVEGPGIGAGCWAIRTWDADGYDSVYEYEAEHLRPAGRAVQFRWPTEPTDVHVRRILGYDAHPGDFRPVSGTATIAQPEPAPAGDTMTVGTDDAKGMQAGLAESMMADHG